VKIDAGEDWTDGFVRAAARAREIAAVQRVELAILMDISAACGTQVIYDGPRHLKQYRRGPGVTAAVLMRVGVTVVSQRDTKTLARIARKLGQPEIVPEGTLVDWHEVAWYRGYFGA
jgi:uncharacterized protein YbbK (DUF523 family)